MFNATKDEFLTFEFVQDPNKSLTVNPDRSNLGPVLLAPVDSPDFTIAHGRSVNLENRLHLRK